MTFLDWNNKNSKISVNNLNNIKKTFKDYNKHTTIIYKPLSK